MKFTLSLITALICFSVAAQFANDSLSVAPKKPITYNYKKCKISIKAASWEQFGQIKRLPLTISIYNNSADTLKYGLWTTNWLNYYVDNKQISIRGFETDILHNFFQVFVLGPYKTTILNDYIFDTVPGHVFHGKFRLVFNLRLCRGDEMVTPGLVLNDKDGTFSSVPEDEVKKRSHLVRSNRIIL